MKKLVVLDHLKKLADSARNYVDSSVLKVTNSTLQSLTALQNKLVPSGGLPGQVLIKKSKTDHDVEWTGYIVNDDLLDNSYFVGGGSHKGGGQFPINQRGQTEWTSSGYTIDRWYLIKDGNGTVKLTSDGIEIIRTSGTYFDFRQRMQSIDESSQYTFSILTSEGLYSGTSSKDSPSILTVPISSIGHLYFIKESGTWQVLIRSIRNDAPILVKAAKLERGDRQTLAHQDADGNWVLNKIPDFATELAKCQRYQIQLRPESYNNYICLPCQHALKETEMQIFIPTPVTLRTLPTISYTGKFILVNYENGSSDPGIEVTDIKCKYYTTNGIYLTISTAGNLRRSVVYSFAGFPEANLLIDSNL